jgi:hypothetical protein
MSNRVDLQQSEEGISFAISRAYTALGMQMFLPKANSNIQEKRHETTTALKIKRCAYFGFSKQNPLSKSNVGTEPNMEKIHRQIMLSDAG